MNKWRPGSYRPPDFKNPFNPATILAYGSDGKPISHQEAWEYSADAMLEALRKGGQHVCNDGLSLYGMVKPEGSGTLVFIPDDEVDG